MSQNPYANPYPQQYAQPYPPGVGMAPPARTSVMAVLSLVCSLLCCIPGVSVLGVLFGGLALLAIAMSGGKVRGVGLAIAGLIIGIIVSVMWIGGAWAAMTWLNQMGRSTETVITGLRDGDQAVITAAFESGAEAQITDERRRAFSEAIASDLGQYDRTPDGIVEWIEGWESIESDPDVGPAVERAQQRYRNNLIPVPMMYDGQWEMFLVVFNQGTNQQSPESYMVPEFRDIGVVRDDGSIQWLVAGNDGGGTGTIPNFIPPALLPDLDRGDPDMDPEGDPSADESGEDPEDEPAPTNRRRQPPKA